MERRWFDYSPIIDRPIIQWPNNARVAFWLSPNVEYLEYDPPPNTRAPDYIGAAIPNPNLAGCGKRARRTDVVGGASSSPTISVIS